jgi:hypothetical protein
MLRRLHLVGIGASGFDFGLESEQQKTPQKEKTPLKRTNKLGNCHPEV